MLSTLINVGSGSILKLVGYAISRLIESWAESKRQDNEFKLTAIKAKTEQTIALQSGVDTADDFTKRTRRILTWMLGIALCYIVVTSAHYVDWNATFLIERDKTGLLGWITGARKNTEISIAAQVIFNYMTLLEIMFGFYYTKVGKDG